MIIAALFGIFLVWGSVPICSVADAPASSRAVNPSPVHSPIDNVPGLLVERGWLKPPMLLIGRDNTLVAKQVVAVSGSDLYRYVSKHVSGKIERATRTILFQENVAGISFVRSTGILFDATPPLRHSRTVVVCPQKVCAVFDEVRAVSTGSYVLGPVWRLKSEADWIAGATGILFGIDDQRTAILTFGPTASTHTQVIEGTKLEPAKAQSHVYCLASRKMDKTKTVRFCSAFIPAHGEDSPPAKALRQEGEVIGLAFVTGGNSAILIGSGNRGSVADYGPIRTDAACFFAGDIREKATLFIHFVKATVIGIKSEAIIRQVRLNGAVLPIGAWRFKDGRAQIEWPEPRTGVLALVMMPFVPPGGQ